MRERYITFGPFSLITVGRIGQFQVGPWGFNWIGWRVRSRPGTGNAIAALVVVITMITYGFDWFGVMLLSINAAFAVGYVK